MILYSRSNSLEPFVRHFTTSLMEKLEIVDDKSIHGKLFFLHKIFLNIKIAFKNVYFSERR